MMDAHEFERQQRLAAEGLRGITIDVDPWQRPSVSTPEAPTEQNEAWAALTWLWDEALVGKSKVDVLNEINERGHIVRRALRAASTDTAALQRVRALHVPFGIYDECEHTPDEILLDVGGEFLDELTEPREGAAHLYVEEVGWTCQLMYSICRSCCIGTPDWRGQTEDCANDHDHGADKPICPTAAALAGRSVPDEDALTDGSDTPWPTRELLALFVEWSNHFLSEHSCDHYRYETLHSAVNAARDRLAASGRSAVPEPAPTDTDITKGSDEDYYHALIGRHGRCVCVTGVCDDDACALCDHLDPEWPCPHDEDAAEVYGPFIAGDGEAQRPVPDTRTDTEEAQ